jgi:SAM-dependent methyltransferase
VSDWFERWFGEEYLALYPHRNEEEAGRVVALLGRHGIGGRGQRVLDLACGAGRHLRGLAAGGAVVVGYDLSLALLRTASRRGAANLVRGDMRSIGVASGACDAVVNLFTSFGYFDSDEQHQRVVLEVARVLQPGGLFAIDYLNTPLVRRTLVPRDEFTAGGSTVVQERSLSADGRFVVKSIHIQGEGRSFVERVRLFERSELETICRAAGLEPRTALGDYDGGRWSATSPRLLLIAERT